MIQSIVVCSLCTDFKRYNNYTCKANEKVFSLWRNPCLCKKHNFNWGDGVIGRRTCDEVGGKGNNRKIKIYRSNYPMKMPNHSYDNGNDPKVKAVSVH